MGKYNLDFYFKKIILAPGSRILRRATVDTIMVLCFILTTLYPPGWIFVYTWKISGLMYIFVLKFPGMQSILLPKELPEGLFFPVLLIGVHVFRVPLVWVEK